MRASKTLLLSIAVALALAGSATAKGLEEFNPVLGPALVALGDNLAQLALGRDYQFIDGPNTRVLLKRMGNPSSEADLGIVLPRGELDWFIVFEYQDTGYVRDEDAGTLDAAAILRSIQRGTDAANEMRRAEGHPAVHIEGWAEMPHYDTKSRRLMWALAAKADDAPERIINYNTRVLGRHGFISVILVTDDVVFERTKRLVPEIIAGVTFKPGKRYEEFVAGQDRIAEYGLAALIAAGAGVGAVKAAQSGLLMRFWKWIVLTVIGVAGAAWRWLTGRNRETSA